MVTVSSYGAAGEVTGSLYLVESEELKILVDCGLFQGEGEERNREAFAFEPAGIDYLILTHAHLDHTGRAPLLCKRGFEGTVITTRPSYEIAREMLANSAGVMEANARGAEMDGAGEPLYTEREVVRLFELPVMQLSYHDGRRLAPGASVELIPAGHILGSAVVVLIFEEAGRRKRLVFSGDLGRPRRLLIPGTERVREADVAFIEATYGDRAHQPLQEAIRQFEDAVSATIARGGVVMIPAFSLERTQEIIHLLSRMRARGKLHVGVYLDSPLAIRVTELYARFRGELRRQLTDRLSSGEEPFRFPGLEMLASPEQSIELNDLEEPGVIIAGAGMCEGGRIGHHFRFHADDPNNTILFVGFQVPGTKGARILDGEEVVPFYGHEVRFRAEILYIDGFSAHGDYRDILSWIGGFDKLERICLVHGDPPSLEAMRARIEERFGLRAEIVEPYQRIHV